MLLIFVKSMGGQLVGLGLLAAHSETYFKVLLSLNFVSFVFAVNKKLLLLLIRVFQP
jgi:hypothetical protein